MRKLIITEAELKKSVAYKKRLSLLQVVKDLRSIFSKIVFHEYLLDVNK